MRASTALFAVLACSSLFAQDYLPLGDGNYWTYRSGSSTFTITVGTPYFINNLVYYSVKGYGTGNMLVRRTDEGNLVQLDEETGVETPVTIFEPGKSWTSPLSGCMQSAETAAKRGEFAGPAGIFVGVLTVNYTGGGCADAGFVSDVYSDNIGMLRRTVLTFAGPMEYDLVAARVGKFTFRADPDMVTHLTVPEVSIARDSMTSPFPVQAVLSVDSVNAYGVTVKFPTAQRTDFVIRATGGQVVYKWSDGQVFAEVEGEEQLGGRREFVMDGLVETAGLEDGMYTIEAWFTTVDGPKLAASTMVQLYTRAER